MPTINESVDTTNLPTNQGNVVTNLTRRNNGLRNTLRAWGLLGPCAGAWGLLGRPGLVWIRGHTECARISSVTIHPYFQGTEFRTRFPKNSFPALSGVNFRIKFAWMSYADAAATEHWAK